MITNKATKHQSAQHPLLCYGSDTNYVRVRNRCQGYQYIPLPFLNEREPQMELVQAKF